MNIGYSVEGSTDRALIKGLAKRWCPYAATEEGRFRGSTHTSRCREMPKICIELNAKNVDLIIFLTDSNTDDEKGWKAVLKQEEGRIPDAYAHLAVVGVCQRNVECWFCSDADWIATKTSKRPDDFRVSDPKDIFETALGKRPDDRKEELIMELAQEAPLRNWLRNRSFEHFYDRLWLKSKLLPACNMENLRARP